MGYTQGLARNIKLLFWSKVFREAKALAVVATLFYLHRGLTMTEIYSLSIVWSITSLLTEVPSGYLADFIGRKKTIILGMMLIVAALIAQIYSHGFASFSLVFILFSAGFSCISGTEEALLYDSLKEVGRAQEMQVLNARLYSSKFVARIFVALVGAYIAKDLTEVQYLYLLKFDILLVLFSLLLSLFLTEPRNETEDLAKKKNSFVAALSTVKAHPWLIRATISRLLLFFSGFFIFRAYQPFLKDNGATVLMIAMYFFLSRGLIFLIHWNAKHWLKWIKTSSAINLSAILATLGLVASLLLEDIWSIIIIFAMATAMIDVRDPLYAKAINQRIESKNRATTISLLNMIKGVLDIPLLLTVGFFAQIDIRNAIIGAIVFCLIAILFFWSKEKEFEDIKL